MLLRLCSWLRKSVRVKKASRFGEENGLNKSESKYFHTAVKMDKAFLSLLEHKDFEYITVKEICNTANVNRSTFYLHYETIGDLLDESVRYMNTQFLDYFPQGEESFIENIENTTIKELYLVTPKYLFPYLTYIQENKRLFQTAVRKSAALGMQDSFDDLFVHVLNPILERFHIPENEKKYILRFYMGAILNVVNEWIKDGCKDSVDLIVKIISDHIARPGSMED